MKMKGIRELLITDVVLVTGLFCFSKTRRERENSIVVPAHRKRAGTALYILHLSNR